MHTKSNRLEEKRALQIDSSSHSAAASRHRLSNKTCTTRISFLAAQGPLKSSTKIGLAVASCYAIPTGSRVARTAAADP